LTNGAGARDAIRAFGIAQLGAAITVNGSGDAVGALFSPRALAHSMRGGIRLETMRQAAYRATDLVITAVSGATTLRTNFGVKITSDATFGTY